MKRYGDDTMTVFKKMIYIFNTRQRIRLIELLAIIIIGAFIELVGVSAVLPFVNVMLDPQSISSTPYLNYIYSLLNLQSTTQFLIVLAIGLIIVYIVKNIYIIFMYNVQYRFTYNNLRRLSNRMMKCYMDQEYLFHVDHNCAELMRNVGNDTAMFFAAVQAGLQLVTEGCVCFALIIYLFFTDKSITIGVAAIFGIFGTAFLKVFRKKLRSLGDASRKNNLEINKWMLQAFGGIKETKIFERESFFTDKFDEEFKSYSEKQRKYMIYCNMPRPIMEAVLICSLLAVICIKLYWGTELEYFVPVLSAFVVAAIRMLPSFNRISSYISALLYNRSAIDSIYHDLKEIEVMERSDKRKGDFSAVIDFSDKISVRDLSFKYPNVDKYVLEKINLEIPKNKSIAFVGASGSGKTTLVDIILGVIQPVEGQVFVDDVDIQAHMSSWHDRIGYIPQTIYLLDDTLKNNVAFGIKEDKIDDEKVWAALNDAQLKSFVEDLNEGLDTTVGERGVKLSGGQRQRIGIARALYHNPDILVLDEATSALDSETESAVMDAINGLKGRKTLIIIAHRLSTIEHCDLIYEIKDNKAILKEK